MCLGAVILTLAFFIKRKIWPHSLKISLLLCKGVLSYLHLMWRVFPLGLSLEVFLTHHTLQLEMCHFWATLNTRQPWIYTEIHMGSCHSISHTWKPWCTLNHFYFSNAALKRKVFTNWEFSVSWLPLYQSRNVKKPQFTTSCRNVRQISIDIPTHYNGIYDRMTT